MIADAVTTGRALADRSRVRALHALSSGELCLCQLVELLGLAPSTVSRHMTILLQAGLVVRRKEGRWHHYRLKDGEDATAPGGLLDWIADLIAGDPQIGADDAAIGKLRGMDREALTACYRT